MSDSPVPFASFCGVDLHQCTVTLRAVHPAGVPIAALTCDTKCIERIRNWVLALPRPLHLAVEAVGFVEGFIDRFRPCVDRIDIADATELATRRGKRRKTDRNDALDVAVRLARGGCPLGWIADEPVMQLRKLGRHWRSLSRILSRAKHCMQSMLLAANLRGPRFDGGNAASVWRKNHRFIRFVWPATAPVGIRPDGREQGFIQPGIRLRALRLPGPVTA